MVLALPGIHSGARRLGREMLETAAGEGHLELQAAGGPRPPPLR